MLRKDRVSFASLRHSAVFYPARDPSAPVTCLVLLCFTVGRDVVWTSLTLARDIIKQTARAITRYRFRITSDFPLAPETFGAGSGCFGV